MLSWYWGEMSLSWTTRAFYFFRFMLLLDSYVLVKSDLSSRARELDLYRFEWLEWELSAISMTVSPYLSFKLIPCYGDLGDFGYRL